ncbi:NAD(P)H-binding protein [Flavivirga amylovorans]|uniref:NAD(P)H-binding protein n=1 Tax=Flavivirga amylovorans TaxID=870486 RepID=A0ABT8WVY4_9FLAO|nr:NAD(P)H-binding protein [Flavivirga amylovorans]MDO5985847.1 NAD(P)H-binding protein [Flavivirga amylovorans]
MKIVIGAAAGNVGSRIAKKVAAANHSAILLGNKLLSLENLNIPNSSSYEVDMSNVEQVVTYTKGADALFWLVPPALGVSSLKEWYDDIIAAGVAAIKENKIPRVVVISSLGAGASENLGTVTYVGNMEKAFKKVAPNVVFLRPGYFMENFLLQKGDILKNGYFSFPYDQNHDIPFISADDIGDVAAEYLMDAHWAGQWTRNIMGPRNITPQEAADIFSEELQKEITYKQVSYDDIKNQFAQFGANDTVQNELVDLYKALGDPNGAYATPRTIEANTPTTLEQIIRNKFISA